MADTYETTQCSQMGEAEAKQVILQDPAGNIQKRIEAILVAQSVLGDDCTMAQIYKWAES